MSSNLKGLRRGDKRIILSCNSLVGSPKRSLFTYFFPFFFFGFWLFIQVQQLIVASRADRNAQKIILSVVPIFSFLHFISVFWYVENCSIIFVRKLAIPLFLRLFTKLYTREIFVILRKKVGPLFYGCAIQNFLNIRGKKIPFEFLRKISCCRKREIGSKFSK